MAGVVEGVAVDAGGGDEVFCVFAAVAAAAVVDVGEQQCGTVRGSRSAVAVVALHGRVRAVVEACLRKPRAGDAHGLHLPFLLRITADGVAGAAGLAVVEIVDGDARLVTCPGQCLGALLRRDRLARTAAHADHGGRIGRFPG